jgi:hypothetical protein
MRVNKCRQDYKEGSTLNKFSGDENPVALHLGFTFCLLPSAHGNIPPQKTFRKFLKF